MGLSRAEIEERDQEIIMLYKKKVSVRYIAMLYTITPARVYQILKNNGS